MFVSGIFFRNWKKFTDKVYLNKKILKFLYPLEEIVSNEGIGLISVGLDGSVGAMKPLKGYDVTQVRELNGIREKVRSIMHSISSLTTS